MTGHDDHAAENVIITHRQFIIVFYTRITILPFQ